MSDSEARATTGRSSSRGSKAASRSPSRGASSSPPPRSATSGSARRKSTPGSSYGASGASSSKKKKGKGSKKKKKKKKPIVEEPKFVRDLLAKADANDLEWVRHFLQASEYHLKFDLAQTAGEALVAAALKNHAEMVSILLAAGANANLANGKALQRASYTGALEAAEVLVKAGADVNAKSVFAEYVPLHYAAQTGSSSLVRFLLASGATADTPCHLEQCGTFNGWNALHFAADAGHLDVIAQLLEAGASIDHANSNGDTALSIAAERGQWDVARWLVAVGANIHATRRGLSVVQWGVYRGDHDAVQFLVSYGAVPALAVRVLWFPTGLTLKEVIYKQFSEDIYDQIDLAIYRGGKQALEREAKKRILAAVQWESQPQFDPFSFETTSAMQKTGFPPHIVNLIAGFEM